MKVGQLKTNKAATLYAHPDGAYCVALASSPCGEKICSGHIDGTVWTFDFADGVNRKLFAHSCSAVRVVLGGQKRGRGGGRGPQGVLLRRAGGRVRR